jgi:hypothetical protein
MLPNSEQYVVRCFQMTVELLASQDLGQFDALVLNSILRLPKAILLQRKMGDSMSLRLIRSKMLLENANKLLLCYTINCTADYLTSYADAKPRSPYVRVLETYAAKTTMYWRLLDCLTTEPQKYIRTEEIRVNALIAAIGVNEIFMVQKLLEEGVNAASSSPFFGEALAAAASSGSLKIVQLLLNHWDWETHRHFVGSRLMNAVEAAAVADHEDVLVKLLDHRDRIARSMYDGAIYRMIRNNQMISVDRLLVLRQEDPDPAANAEFWLHLVRMAAEYNRSTFLQHILTKGSHPSVGEASLVIAMKDACLKNHGAVVQTILPYLSNSNPIHYADSLFWAARFGNMGTLRSLLTFLQNDQCALLLALAGAVSGKVSSVISHLLDLAGVRITDSDAPTRFTDIVRLITPGIFSHDTNQSDEPFLVSVQVDDLRAAARIGKLVDVISILNAIRAHYPDRSLVAVSGAFSDAAKNNRLDVLLFLCENWIPYLANGCVKAPAVAQLFMDFGWDFNQADQGSKYPRSG